MANELTAARRGVGPGFHAIGSVLMWNGLPASSICGLGRVKVGWPGISRCRRASTVLMKPAIPAAAAR